MRGGCSGRFHCITKGLFVFPGRDQYTLLNTEALKSGPLHHCNSGLHKCIFC